MNWAMLALGLFLGCLGGVLLAAFARAVNADLDCTNCLDAAKAESWDRTVLALEALGEPVVSPRVIADLARMAYARTPEEAARE